MFLKSVPKEIQILFLLLILSLSFHLYNYPERVNFSMDQAKFSIKALDLWENKELSLIGPTMSFNVEGREIFQGGIIYYFQLIFLLLGNLDPVLSSGLFAVFAVTMAIPLYIGTNLLLGKNKGLLITAVYLLVPLFVTYTNFFWNPNYQLALLPLLFLFFGLYKKTQKWFYLLFAGIWMGLIVQFHYQLALSGIFILIWIKLFLKTSWTKLLIFLVGGIIGFLPILIFEFRNHFYNLNTVIYFLNNFEKAANSSSGFTHPHYYLSWIVIGIFLVVSMLKKVELKYVYLLIGFLTIWNILTLMPKPNQEFGTKRDWNFQDEKKVFQIIRDQNITGYNMTNLDYDTVYQVQKYLHKINNLSGNIKDYWETDKLFVVIPNDEKMEDDQAYEVRIMKPYKIVNQWEINPNYNLYLIQKI